MSVVGGEHDTSSSMSVTEGLLDSSLVVCSCERVEEESLIKNSSACKDYLIEAMKYHLLPADQRALMKTARTRMRTPACCPKVAEHILTDG